MEVVKKIILTGHFGVGKTSLVQKFVHQKFSEIYMTTIGVKIDKKVVDCEGIQVKLMIWDLAGESTARKVPTKYFGGAHGLFYVFDLTREETYKNIDDDLFELQKLLSNQPFIVLANKSDLVEDTFIENLSKELTVPFKITSAKTGENVEDAFLALAAQTL